jgi:hypothetical protein
MVVPRHGVALDLVRRSFARSSGYGTGHNPLDWEERVMNVCHEIL